MIYDNDSIYENICKADSYAKRVDQMIQKIDALGGLALQHEIAGINVIIQASRMFSQLALAKIESNQSKSESNINGR